MGVDFRDQLRRQILFLRSSSRLFDDGDLEEAIRLATVLRILFHTTRSSTSLLTHLNAESCNLLSTAPAVQGERHPFALVDTGFVARIGEPFLANPKLDGAVHRRFIPFDEWWQQEAILLAGGLPAGHVNRRDLVLWAVNKDGGAHVDDRLPAGYQLAIDGLGMTITAVAKNREPMPKNEQVKAPLEKLHFANLRQIAYEVLNSPEVLGFVTAPPSP